MHNMDCNGVISIIAGSVIRPLLYRADIGNTIHARLETVNAHLSEHYSVFGVRCQAPPFKVANLTDDTGYSCLAGPGIKAANTRELVPFLVEMADLYNGSASLHDQALRKLLKALSRILEIIWEGNIFLSQSDLRQLAKQTIVFADHFMLLADLARINHTLDFKVSPKVHQMQHIPSQATFMNPRFLQNYMEESMIGCLAQMYRGARNGPSSELGIQRTVLIKYLIGIQLRFEGFR